MRDNTAVQRRLRAWSRANHGVIGRVEALRLGATDALIRHKVASGQWEPIHRTVYRDAAAPTSAHQILRAACVVTSPVGVASHRSAAWLWGLLDQPPTVPDITIPAPLQHGRHASGVVLHQSRDLDRAAVSDRHGIPATNPLRTLVDLGASVSTEQLIDAIDRAVANQLVTIPALLAELDRLGRRGRPGPGVLRQLLRQRGFVDIPAPSVLESQMQRLFHNHHLPMPAAEVRHGPHGEYRLDFAYADRQLAIEVDGYVWHFSPEHLQRDHTRRNQLQAAGWRVLVYTWRDVTQDPKRVASEIAAAYQAAA